MHFWSYYVSLQITQALNFAGHYWVIQLEQVPKIVICEKKSLFLSQGRNQEYFRPPMVRVDPERRCSVMLIYGTHLVVLPFRQEGILEEQDVAFSGRLFSNLIFAHCNNRN